MLKFRCKDKDRESKEKQEILTTSLHNQVLKLQSENKELYTRVSELENQNTELSHSHKIQVQAEQAAVKKLRQECNELRLKNEMLATKLLKVKKIIECNYTTELIS